MGELAVLGVRHHGPGSARSVLAALEELCPEAVVIEGATELDRIAPLAASPAMQPPVAALVYGAEQPERAMFYPLASFSPEWVAMRWALAKGLPVRFADLAASHSLSPELRLDEPGADRVPLEDPIAAIARAAGYDDAERWWEDAIEHRPYGDGGPGASQGTGAFVAVADLMAEARTGAEARELDLVREAAMRRVLRQVVKQSQGPVAMVCGAWHAPALAQVAWPPASADNALLRRLPKFKVQATWVPWTTKLLSMRSGYGAGVSSPGWYEHLFSSPDSPVERWLVRTARLLRHEELAAPPAAAIEAARLAEALAVLRGRPLPGLAELWEASQAVMCAGSPVPMGLVAERLVVGNAMGSVPPQAPMVPLARDLALQQSRLRLRPCAAPAALVLDLRSPMHRQRSALFHRLAVLGVHWAVPGGPGRTGGTFKETWQLQWQPELEVSLVVASPLGNTVAGAAAKSLEEQAAGATLEGLCTLVEKALLADMPGALGPLVAALGERSALAHDVRALLGAVEPLARAWRYGTVRRFDRTGLGHVLDGIMARAVVGLPLAATGLDDEAAATLSPLVASAQRGMAIYDDEEAPQAWAGAMAQLLALPGVHGLLAGQAARALADGGWAGAQETRQRVSQALSPGTPPRWAAAFLQGFLAGEALLLVHDEDLLGVIDAWVATVPADIFDDLLPLLRRAFSSYLPAERRLIGERAQTLATGPGAKGRRHEAAAASTEMDGRARQAAARAVLVRPVMAAVLGLQPEVGARPRPQEQC